MIPLGLLGEFGGDVNKFLACISLADFRPTIEQRKSIARKLADIEASQRAIAEVVGVDQATVSRDLKHSSDANASPTQKKPNETKAHDPLGDANASSTPDSDHGGD